MYQERWSQGQGDGHGGGDVPTWFRLVAGAVAGLAGQGTTYPFDLVRRRMQTEGFTAIHAHHTITAPAAATAAAASPAGGGGGAAIAAVAAIAGAPATGGGSGGGVRAAAAPRTSMSETMARVVRTEGVRGLFKGVTMNLVKGPVGVGVSFTLYDLLKRTAHIQ
jgi:hypothetical protein